MSPVTIVLPLQHALRPVKAQCRFFPLGVGQKYQSITVGEQFTVYSDLPTLVTQLFRTLRKLPLVSESPDQGPPQNPPFQCLHNVPGA